MSSLGQRHMHTVLHGASLGPALFSFCLGPYYGSAHFGRHSCYCTHVLCFVAPGRVSVSPWLLAVWGYAHAAMSQYHHGTVVTTVSLQ
jgi:hypothetical protein